MKKLLFLIALLPSLVFAQKISDLPAASTLGGTEVVAGVQSSTTKKISANQIAAYVQTFLVGVYQPVLVSGTNIKTINGTSLLGSGNLVISGGGGGGDLLSTNNLSDLASAATARTNLGLGTLATQSGTFSGTHSGASSGTNTGDQDLSSYATTSALTSGLAGKQALDSDLTTISGLTVTTDNFLQAKGSAWASRTIAQVKTDLGLTGTNSGDQDLSSYATSSSVTAAIAAAKGKIYYTSVAGAVSDADLSLGSTTFGTDNTTVLQNLLNTVGPKTIIVDGKYSTKGLIINSNTRIVCLPGCGFILRNHADDDSGGVVRSGNLLRNEHWLEGQSANSVDQNIEFIGGIYNGNGYNAGTGGNDYFDVANGGSAVSGSAQRRVELSRLNGIDNLLFRDVTLLAPRLFAIHGWRDNNVTIENMVIDFGLSSTRDLHNYDGIHLTHTSNIYINNVRISKAKDDNIAIAACDDYTTGGPITNIVIQNIYLDNTTTTTGYGFRFYASSTATVDKLTVNNVRGYSRNYLFRFGNPSGQTNASYGTVTLEDIDVDLGDTADNSDDAYVFASGIFKQLILKDIHRYEFTSAYPYIKTTSTSAIRHLQIAGFNMRNTGTAFAAPLVSVVSGATVNTLEMSETYIDNTNVSTGALVNNVGTIGTLRLNGMFASGIQTLVNNSGTLSNIQASNILHSSATTSFVTSSTVNNFYLSNFLTTGTRSSGTYTVQNGDGFGSVTDGDKGDVTVSSLGTVYTIDNVDMTKASNTLAKANGGTGTTTPALVAGSGIGITGTWPNNTISYTGGGGGGATAFTGLSDVPSAYTGGALKVVRVNAAANALEFATAGTGDLVGPSSAVDGKPVVWDGTTGKLVKAGPTAYTDYSGSTTITNLGTSPTTAIVHYYDDGIKVHVWWSLVSSTTVSGTANITFTLPVAPNASYGTSGIIQPCFVNQGGTSSSGVMVASGSSTTVNIYATSALGPWGSGVTRQTKGQITYEK